MRLQAVALVAGLAGLGVSIYLTAVHYAGVPLACPTTSIVNCEAVLSSSYAVIGGSSIPTSAAGIAWFAVSAAIAIAVLMGRGERSLVRWQLAWSAIGMLTVLYLVYIEIVRLGVVCAWCSVAHALVLVIFLIALPRPAAAPGRQ
ncbi:MAG: vitamin K epoxide reductase family protein [Candidatus Dormibacteraceae bacterium]